MVLAHNSILVWDWLKGCPISLEQCETQCILYSARICGHYKQELIVASGTVFNRVLLWKPSSGERDKTSNRIKVNLSLIGHDGVIFGIRFSATLQRVCSVSDDRTVRLWTLPTDWMEKYGQTVPAADLVLYGHLARVWDAHFVGNTIISCSEDATCKVWTVAGECERIIEGHQGRNIWSMAINKKQSLLATGGGDCTVLLTQVNQTAKPKSLLYKLTLEKEQEQEGEAKSRKDFVRSICLLTSSNALCLTDSGKLLSISLDPLHKSYRAKCLHEDPSFSSYSVFSVSPCRSFVALGNLEGKLKVAKLHITADGIVLGQDVVLEAHSGKVFSLVFLETEQLESLSPVSMLTTGPQGHMVWWEVCPSEDDRVPPILHRRASLTLPPSKHRWTTAAVAATSLSRARSCVLVCGDRKGSIHSFIVPEGPQISEADVALSPVCSLVGLHGPHGVSSLGASRGSLYSTGRDGHIHVFALQPNGALRGTEKRKVFKGFDWIERLVLVHGQEYVVGFHGSDLLMYNLTQQQTVLCVPCGGGHRAWDFTLNSKGNGKHGLVYLKGPEIHFHQIELDLEPQQMVLQQGFHGRETNCLLQLSSSQGGGHFLTGSEDCSLRLSHCDTASGSIVSSLPYQGHISSVRALASSEAAGEKARTLLFSGGGRARLLAWDVQGLEDSLPYSKPPSSLSSTCPFSPSPFAPSPAHPRLVFLEKTACGGLISDRKRRKLLKNSDLRQPSPDCRIMDLTAFPVALMTGSSPHDVDGLHCIVAACSDGYLRVFIFDEDKGQFHHLEPILEGQYCLFCLEHIVVPAQLSAVDTPIQFEHLESPTVQGTKSCSESTNVCPAHRMESNDAKRMTDPNVCTQRTLVEPPPLPAPTDTAHSVPVPSSGVHTSGPVQPKFENSVLVLAGSASGVLHVVDLTGLLAEWFACQRRGQRETRPDKEERDPKNLDDNSAFLTFSEKSDRADRFDCKSDREKKDDEEIVSESLLDHFDHRLSFQTRGEEEEKIHSLSQVSSESQPNLTVRSPRLMELTHFNDPVDRVNPADPELQLGVDDPRTKLSQTESDFSHSRHQTEPASSSPSDPIQRDNKESNHSFSKPNSDQNKPQIGTLPVHQSGVNCLDVLSLDHSETGLHLLATGGDDTALTVAVCQLGSAGVAVLSQCVRESAHCAAITGVVFRDAQRVLSASIDQSISLWAVSSFKESKSINLVHLRSVLTDVADVSSLRIISPAFETKHSESREEQRLGHKDPTVLTSCAPINNIPIVVVGSGIQCLFV